MLPPEDDHLRFYKEFSEDDPLFQVKLLAQRVDALTREKEEIEGEQRDLEKRVADMEKSFQRGAGALIVLPIFGALIGIIFAYGKIIFAPWLGAK